ncbi:hypothetical protein [Caldimonas tepidiphila]|uniref:deoxynucleotide monophosphate kinase family protein n=1 Tax=Caldimonas tepidiphila TaxID=2315841 RepID=UPI000E5BF2CE|nr:hypothetical protein [Caldimonas tepidiphila]
MHAQPLLLGLIGFAGCGKSTAARYLEDQHGFEQLGLADPIRNMLCALLDAAGAGGEWMTERALKELPVPTIGVSYRHLAQTLGTEWGRAISPDFWLRIGTGKLLQAKELGIDLVLSDIRFPNEAAWIKAHGGVLVRISRPGLPSVRDHESERHSSTLPADHEIDNRGSMACLRDQLDSLIHELRVQQLARNAA